MFLELIKKNKFTLATALMLLLAMPHIFNFIENRQGHTINDPLLDIIPATDLSVPIFIAMYSLALLYIVRCFGQPQLVFSFIRAYIIITCLRFACMLLLPMEPPAKMVELVDPFTKIFYGGKLITKDLFFSGHTSTMFLFFLLLSRPGDKFLAIAVSFFIAMAVLVQHVHYSIDVLAAFPITYLVYLYTEKKLSWMYLKSIFP